MRVVLIAVICVAANSVAHADEQAPPQKRYCGFDVKDPEGQLIQHVVFKLDRGRTLAQEMTDVPAEGLALISCSDEEEGLYKAATEAEDRAIMRNFQSPMLNRMMLPRFPRLPPHMKK